jgi:hypothetical protein
VSVSTSSAGTATSGLRWAISVASGASNVRPGQLDQSYARGHGALVQVASVHAFLRGLGLLVPEFDQTVAGLGHRLLRQTHRPPMVGMAILLLALGVEARLPRRGW